MKTIKISRSNYFFTLIAPTHSLSNVDFDNNGTDTDPPAETNSEKKDGNTKQLHCDNDYLFILLLGLRNPWENFLSRSKDGHWIKAGLPLEESWPSIISKMPLPIILRSIVRQIQLEIKPLFGAILYNFLVLGHQILERGTFWVWWSET